MNHATPLRACRPRLLVSNFRWFTGLAYCMSRRKPAPVLEMVWTRSSPSLCSGITSQLIISLNPPKNEMNESIALGRLENLMDDASLPTFTVRVPTIWKHRSNRAATGPENNITVRLKTEKIDLHFISSNKFLYFAAFKLFDNKCLMESSFFGLVLMAMPPFMIGLWYLSGFEYWEYTVILVSEEIKRMTVKERRCGREKWLSRGGSSTSLDSAAGPGQRSISWNCQEQYND
jgi:hypothetical protein